MFLPVRRLSLLTYCSFSLSVYQVTRSCCPPRPTHSWRPAQSSSGVSLVPVDLTQCQAHHRYSKRTCPKLCPSSGTIRLCLGMPGWDEWCTCLSVLKRVSPTWRGVLLGIYLWIHWRWSYFVWGEKYSCHFNWFIWIFLNNEDTDSLFLPPEVVVLPP